METKQYSYYFPQSIQDDVFDTLAILDKMLYKTRYSKLDIKIWETYKNVVALLAN